jgi:hypothetical protein
MTRHGERQATPSRSSCRGRAWRLSGPER